MAEPPMAEPLEGSRGRHLVGSFETWTYGAGLAYAGLELPAEDVRFVPAVVRLPPGATPADLASRQGEPSDVRLLWPELWSGLADGGSQDAETSWPVILDLGDARARRRLDLETVVDALNRASEPIRASMRARGLRGEPTFRLNAPLPPTTVASGLSRGVSRPRDATGQAAHAHHEQVAHAHDMAGRELVIVAVIDDGLPFAHAGLRNAAGTGTRVEYCWLQGAQTSGTGSLLFGREFTRSDIDALVAAHGPDEDAIYARAGALDPIPGRTATVNRFASHGSHVLDAAAGQRDGADAGDLDAMRVIAVQLPAAVTIDTTGYGKHASILAALHYIFARAEDVAAAWLGDRHAPVKLFINFSYGYTGGPHDGSARIEMDIAQLIAARTQQGKPTTLVMPSGNTFADRMHGEIPADTLGAGYTIPWALQPNDRTVSYLELWFPLQPDANGSSAFTLHCLDPFGRACQPVAFDISPALASALVPPFEPLWLDGVATGHWSVERYNVRWRRVLVVLNATEPAEPALPAAAAGVWSLTLKQIGGGPLSGPVGCRIQRDNDPYGYARGGRQSAFDDPLDERFTPDGALSRIENPPGAFVRRFGTVNGIATHGQVLVVSGRYGDTNRATEYAGAGRLRDPTTPPGPGDVRISAVSDASTALRGVLSAGARSGSVVRLSGTSVAAPQVTRRLALRAIRGVKGATPVVQPPPNVSEEEAIEWLIRVGLPASA